MVETRRYKAMGQAGFDVRSSTASRSQSKKTLCAEPRRVCDSSVTVRGPEKRSKVSTNARHASGCSPRRQGIHHNLLPDT
jgi:hypothetical protein